MSHQGYYTGSSNFDNVNELLNEAELYRDQSLQYSLDAAASEANAATSEANALASSNSAGVSSSTAIAAATDATNAASAATSAATAAQGSETAADASATAAAASASSASTSAANASTSASTASSAATSASTSASNASSSASAAAASASSASTSASNAATSATNASNSASSASTSATNAGNSATAAAGSASSASTSASNAATSASAAAASASLAAASATSLVGRNRIINGKMEVAQRGGTLTAAPNNAYLLDRWQYSNTSTGVCTMSQETDAPPNSIFRTSLRLTVTTFDNAIAAGDAAVIQQKIEGYNMRDLVGRTFTLSFWVRSSKTGVHCVSFGNSGFDRSYVAEYTVTAANTWEYKTITIVGGLISTGTWDYLAGVGLNVRWTLMAGTTFRTTAGSWQTGNFLATSNQVNCFDTNGNIFAITGVKLEEGPTATAYGYRSIEEEFADCCRYFFRGGYGATGGADSTAQVLITLLLKVRMRSTPTASVIAGSGGSALISISGAASINTIASIGASLDAVFIVSNGGYLAGAQYLCVNTIFEVNAEL